MRESEAMARVFIPGRVRARAGHLSGGRWIGPRI
jgi:hypothetical protein